MKVLIVGGGMAGLSAATGLRKANKTVEITVVEPKDYMEIHWASYRNIFDPKLATETTFDLQKWAADKSVKFVRGFVTKLTPTEATLKDGTVLSFDSAVICTGARMEFGALGRDAPSDESGWGTRKGRLAKLEAEGKKYVNAKSVVVVGGGLVGVEFASDLAFYAKEAGKSVKVTLVHSKDHVCPEMTPKAAAMVQKKLGALGVQVILNEKVVKEGTKYVFQNSKKAVEADEVVFTTGISSCNSFLDSKFLDDKGWVAVDDYFRVKGAENKLFAIGDCCEPPFAKPKAGAQILGIIGTERRGGVGGQWQLRRHREEDDQGQGFPAAILYDGW